MSHSGGTGVGAPFASMEAEMESVKRMIVEKEAELGRLPAGDPERAPLQGRLAALEGRLTALQEEKNIYLRQAQVAATAQPSVAPPDIDGIIERAVKRARAEEEVSVSAFGSEHWGHLSSAARLRMSPSVRLPSIGSQSTPHAQFQWTDASEDQQADRYMAYLKSIFPISNCTSPSPLVWLEGGNKNRSLLTVVGMEHVLYYRSIKGNTDAAIITRASNDCLLPSSGLCILFELKKPENMGPAAAFKATAQVVLANMLSTDFRPVLVLTDLQDHWQLHWINGSDLMSGFCANRSDALAIIATCVSHAEQAATGHTSWEAAAPAAAATQLPAALVNRQRAAFALEAGGQAGASLADLSGDVPDDELRAAHASVLMQQLSQLPVFSNMAPHKPPPFSMYS